MNINQSVVYSVFTFSWHLNTYSWGFPSSYWSIKLY